MLFKNDLFKTKLLTIRLKQAEQILGVKLWSTLTLNLAHFVDNHFNL